MGRHVGAARTESGGRVEIVNGPDLPPPDRGLTIEEWRRRWPVAVEKSELVDGVMVFAGEFDSRDVAIARRTYPGRQVLLTEDGCSEVHPQSDVPARPLAETVAERRAARKHVDKAGTSGHARLNGV